MVCFFSVVGAFGQKATVLSSSGNKVTVNAEAATSTLGLIQLSGDLAGTAVSPTITNDAVLKKTLTGIDTDATGTIANSNTVLEAFGKLQGQINIIGGDAILEVNNQNFQTTVYMNKTTPAASTIFSLSFPPTAHNASLMANVNNLYIASDASTWYYKSANASYSKFISTRPRGVTVWANSDVSVPAAGQSFLTSFATPLMNTSSGAWNASTGVYTVNRAGVYRIDFKATYSYSSTWVAGTELSSIIFKNGNPVSNGSNFIEATSIPMFGASGMSYTTIYCDVGDRISVGLYQSTPNTLTLTGGTGNTLSIIEIQ